MADKIRVGIVGATVTPGGSGWGAKAHVPALKTLPGFELKAVCNGNFEQGVLPQLLIFQVPERKQHLRFGVILEDPSEYAHAPLGWTCHVAQA